MSQPPPYEQKGGPMPQAPYGQQPPPGQYPNQPGPYPNTYPPPGPQPIYQPTVVVTTTNVVPMREFPVLTSCPHCRATITTSTRYETGLMTWLIAGILVLFGCWLGCCLIPFCVDACKDVIHTCPNCHQVVGSYKRLQ